MIVSTASIANCHFDLCIVGSGPAGLIVAFEFARKQPSKRVLVLEYGSSSVVCRNSLDDSIINANPVNHHSPYECTNKRLGGTSLTWGGRCVMYDEADFLNRFGDEDLCTWNTSLFADLRPFMHRAAEYYDCGRPVFNLHELSDRPPSPIAAGFVEGDFTDTTVERWSLPTRFEAKFKKEIEKQKNLFLVQGVEARAFDVPTDTGEVRRLELRDWECGGEFVVYARLFVIAAGAQETTRLLLRNKQLFNRVGGPPYALGRYYQGHVSGKIASAVFYGDPRKTEFGFRRDVDATYIRRRFQMSTAAIVRERVLNTAIWLDNPLYHDPAHGNGAMSLMYLAMITPGLGRRLAPPAIAASVTKGRVNRVPRHLLNVLSGVPASVVIPASIFFRRYCLRRKLPGIFLYNPSNVYALHFHGEQKPDERSRMELDDDGEKLVIRYHISDEDITSVIRVHELLDKWLQNCGCGRLNFWYNRDELPAAIKSMSRDGIHQCGTTRIADSPQRGVVDSSLRVWGTSNLFICSSSVFPTSGQANPTFLLGVFAVKLASELGSYDAVC